MGAAELSGRAQRENVGAGTTAGGGGGIDGARGANETKRSTTLNELMTAPATEGGAGSQRNRDTGHGTDTIKRETWGNER